MKELEIIVEETYKIERTMLLKLSDKQYVDWLNGMNQIENTFKKSHTLNEFIKNSKNIKSDNKDCGFQKLILSNYNQDFKHKECKSFDILYINDKNNQ